MTTTADTVKKPFRSLRSTMLVLTAAAALAGSGAATAAASAPPSDEFPPVRMIHGNQTMEDVARQVLGTGAPGYVARIDNGHRVTATFAGLADLATKRALTSRDQFEAGSNTKTFMAALALQQVDRGRLELDAPISKYLPGVVPNGNKITVRRLLNHTSGLFDFTEDPDFLTDMIEHPLRVMSDQELLDVAFKHAPNFAPGADWSYSNTNYIVIGLLLQKQTGKSLPTLVQERIARPLGLKRTYFAAPRATNTGPGYAHGYAVTWSGAKPSYVDTAGWPIGGRGSAAGAIITTPDDLARFFSGVLGGKLFSRAQLKQMKTTVPLPENPYVKGGYGLGLYRIDSSCGTVWGHGGDTQGHHSTAAATADGRRTAISDTTAEPGLRETSNGKKRFVQVALAAEQVTFCQMLGKPVPAAVTKALHGATAVPAH